MRAPRLTRHGICAVALLVAARASGHAVLVDAALPLQAAIVKQKVEARVLLRFSSAIQPRGSSVELVPAHGDARKLELVFGPGPGEVTATVPPLDAGRYVLRYHVLAADGHATDGTEPLRVAPAD